MVTNWYISKLIFRIDETSAGEVQYDEQWRLIQADNEAEALRKSNSLGQSENEILVKPNGKALCWEFVCVTDVFPFSSKLDGAEIFSRIEQPENEYLYMLSNTAKANRYPKNQPIETA